MKSREILRWGVPGLMLAATSAYAASPSMDGDKDAMYGAGLAPQTASVISVLSQAFSVEAQTNNSNVGGVGALAATNFKGEPGDVITGFEMCIPTGTIGWDNVTDIKICAFVNGSGADFLSNQISGGLASSTAANIGGAPFDLEDDVTNPDVAGLQFVTVTNSQGSATITVDGIADETEWSDNAEEPLVYVNGSIMGGGENPTGFADNNDSDPVTANGSEIDAIRAFVAGGNLYLHIAGNLETNFNKLEIFIDANPAGANQNPLPGTPDPNWGSLSNLANSEFDSGFAPDYYLRYNGNDVDHYLDAVVLGGAGAFTGGARDMNTPLVLGAISAAMDNSNTGGITGPGGGDGTDVATVSDPALVTTGFEFSFDLASLGWNGTDDVRLGGLLAEGDQVSNQVIGGLPNDSGVLGPSDGIDFDTTTGDQFVTIPASAGSGTPTIDGTRDAAYDSFYVNNGGATGNSTSMDDATSGGGPDVDPMASEIDGFSAAIVGTTLYGFVSGNFGDGDRLGLFIDAAPGGQSTLRGDNPDVSGNFFNNLSNLVWDAAFEPEFGIVYNLTTNLGEDGMVGGTGPDADVVEHYVDGAELPTNGAEEQPVGGTFDGGAKSSTNLAGTIQNRVGFGNNTDDTDIFANGSELDNVSVFVDSQFLYVHLGGNLENNFTKLELFFDIIPYDSMNMFGGQNTLLPPDPEGDPELIEFPEGSGTFIPNADYDANPGLDFNALDRMGGPVVIDAGPPEVTQPGFTFEPDFFADHWVYVTNGGDDALFPGEPEWFGGVARLRGALPESPFPSAAPGTQDPGQSYFWGGTSFSDFGEFIDTPGETACLYFLQDNTATNGAGGVAGGVDQYEADESSPAGVDSGIEIKIPLEQIRVPDPGDPTIDIAWDGQDEFKLVAFINGGFHSFVSNQFIPPVCTGELGEPREIDLGAIDGYQALCLVPNGVMTAYTVSPSQPAGDDCIEPIGACCLPDNMCQASTLFGDCIALGGTFLGDMTDCSGSPCDPTGACCLSNGSCVTLTEADCIGSGGTYEGDDVDCMTVTCTVGGACCFGTPDGQTCTDDVSQTDCETTLNGVYAGDSTTCGSAICDTLCKGDLDGDGDNDVFDFNVFAPNFGTLSGAFRCIGDLDGDGDVDVFDFNLYAPDFGCIGTPTGICQP